MHCSAQCGAMMGINGHLFWNFPETGKHLVCRIRKGIDWAMMTWLEKENTVFNFLREAAMQGH